MILVPQPVPANPPFVPGPASASSVGAVAAGTSGAIAASKVTGGGAAAGGGAGAGAAGGGAGATLAACFFWTRLLFFFFLAYKASAGLLCSGETGTKAPPCAKSSASHSSACFDLRIILNRNSVRAQLAVQSCAPPVCVRAVLRCVWSADSSHHSRAAAQVPTQRLSSKQVESERSGALRSSRLR